MEFRNLTPFSVMNYKMLDTSDIEHHVVVMKVGYDLLPTTETGVYQPHLSTKFSLILQDEYVSTINTSSVFYESDLAPFKPFCDVIIKGMAYAPNGIPSESIITSVTLMDAEKNTLLYKPLRCTGVRQFIYDEQKKSWQLTLPKPIRQLPIDYRYAFGGENKIYADEQLQHTLNKENLLPGSVRVNHPEGESAPIAHAAYEYNPLGLGFITPWYQQAKGITSFSAPQIESLSPPITADWMNQQLNASTFQQQPAGFGVIGRAWLPRRLLAGTYDDKWVNSRHPYLPYDFDFQYWNGAPADQQIPYPKTNFTLKLENLTPQGYLQTTLPEHRPFVLLRMQDGLFIPIKLNLDTLVIDAEKQQLALTYRLAFEVSLPIRVCEARFEINPDAPLVRFTQPQEAQTHG